ncbi:hypothetical protein OPKNFCMD_0278 [Methylobacterium crusticola]|uniref:Uncharacterized protein n=1 Tax=Methylobacterium crusticola TaxID=1697972 RepID=A0ABQ4QRR2_9HYPH|nr:hypothetical protein [Methylobacterium crusticola]GJD47570.1 hypothetical protein OPKNFCMD_0278 [Methylobacterium crusticola]
MDGQGKTGADAASPDDVSGGKASAADDTITAKDLKGVSAVPKDGDGEEDGEENTSGASAGAPPGGDADPGTG